LINDNTSNSKPLTLKLGYSHHQQVVVFEIKKKEYRINSDIFSFINHTKKKPLIQRVNKEFHLAAKIHKE
jgi:hypothetical protein